MHNQIHRRQAGRAMVGVVAPGVPGKAPCRYPITCGENGLQAMVKPAKVSRREFLTMSSAAVALVWKPLGAVAGNSRSASTRAVGDAALLDTATVRGLSARVKGSVILPRDPAYDRARRIYNRRFDPHPAMIVQCADSQDVVRAVDFARRISLTTCIRSGGHDHAGYSSCDNTMVIDLAKLQRVPAVRWGLLLSQPRFMTHQQRHGWGPASDFGTSKRRGKRAEDRARSFDSGSLRSG